MVDGVCLDASAVEGTIFPVVPLTVALFLRRFFLLLVKDFHVVRLHDLLHVFGATVRHLYGAFVDDFAE